MRYAPLLMIAAVVAACGDPVTSPSAANTKAEAAAHMPKGFPPNPNV